MRILKHVLESERNADRLVREYSPKEIAKPLSQRMEQARTRLSAFRSASQVILLSLAGLLANATTAAQPPSDLESAFMHPPDSTRPWVNWFWVDGNITKEGITADLEAMQRVGIGGALLMLDVSQDLPPGPAKFGSPEWYGLLRHTMSEAARLSLELSIINGAGWSGSGGPWVTPELSMQQLVWNKTNVTGPVRYDGPLPPLAPVIGYERDVAVLAFPALVGDGPAVPGFAPAISASFAIGAQSTNLLDHNARTGLSVPAPRKGKPQYLQFEFTQPFTAQRLTLATAVSNQSVSGELQISEDGRSFSKVREFVIQRPSLALEFEAVTAKYFRIVFKEMQPAPVPVQISEIELVPLYWIPLPKVRAGNGKAAWPPMPTNVPNYAVLQREKILNLEQKTDSSGRLIWDVPAGQWTIIRFGHVPTGTPVHPPTAEGRGLECDKLSKTAIEKHWAALVGRVATNTNPVGLVGTHIDSWELGFQNWTPAFLAEFQNRRGYDALPFLPAYTGRIVENPEVSERFFWDMRRTIADLFADNYAGRLAELAHEHGLKLSIEAYENGPFDTLQYASRAHVPMAEFWTEKEDNGRWHTSRAMSSAAHTWGKPITAAETFTSHAADGSWINHPLSLKPLADTAMCEGVNHFVFHCFAHQPWLDLKPGMTLGGGGTHYDRNEIWWEQLKPWHQYVARCEYLLQSGLFAADVCYLTPEGAYTDPPVPAKLEPPLPNGYNYDFASPEVLQRMSAQDGRIVLPDGMTYSVLVLPPTDQMTPRFLRKVKELLNGGVTVVAARRPVKSPSLSGYPACDEEVKTLAQEMWGTAGQKRHVIEAKSLSRVLATMGVPPNFEQMTRADGNPLRWIHRRILGPQRTAKGAPVSHPATSTANNRAGSETGTSIEIYFVANSNAQPVTAECAFRVKGLAPEIWLPDTGEIRRPAQWKEQDGRTILTLDLDRFGSVFVVFRKGSHGLDRVAELVRNGKRDEQMQTSFGSDGRLELITFESGLYWAKTAAGRVMEWTVTNLPAPLELKGPWEVEFRDPNHEWKPMSMNSDRHENAQKGAKNERTSHQSSPPEEERGTKRVSFDNLISWTKRNETEIKYFSGLAKYSKKFDLPASYRREGRSIFLDLGEVQVIASVKLNGIELETLWKPPFRVDATKAIKVGTNQLEVEVVNLWVNRLIGDEQLPEDCEWKPYHAGMGCGLLKWPEWLEWKMEDGRWKIGPTAKSKSQTPVSYRTSGRQTFSTWKYWTKDSPLLESGLLGPVRIIDAEILKP